MTVSTGNDASKREIISYTIKRPKLATSESYRLRWATDAQLDDLIRNFREFDGIWGIIAGAVKHHYEHHDVGAMIKAFYPDWAEDSAPPDSPYEQAQFFDQQIQEMLLLLRRLYGKTFIYALRDNNQFVPSSLDEKYNGNEMETIKRIRRFLSEPTLLYYSQKLLDIAKVDMIAMPINFIDQIVLDLSAISKSKTPPSYVSSEDYWKLMLQAFPKPMRSNNPSKMEIPGSFPTPTHDKVRSSHNSAPRIAVPVSGSVRSKKEPSVKEQSRPRTVIQSLLAKRKVSTSDGIEFETLSRSMMRSTPSSNASAFGHDQLGDITSSLKTFSIGKLSNRNKKKNSIWSTSTSRIPKYPRAMRASTSISMQLDEPRIKVPQSSEFLFKPSSSSSYYSKSFGNDSRFSKLDTISAMIGLPASVQRDTSPVQEDEGHDATYRKDQKTRIGKISEQARARLLGQSELDTWASSPTLRVTLPLRPAKPARNIDDIFNEPSEKSLAINDNVKTALDAEKRHLAEMAAEKKRKEDEERLKAELAKRLAETGGLRVPRRNIISPLSKEWEEKSRGTLQRGADETIAVTNEGTTLRSHDFATVVPATEWLNDEIVNGSLNWLDNAVNSAAGVTDVKKQTRKCLALSSFVWQRLQSQVTGTQRMLRRSGVTKDNLLSIDTILLPICERSHWTLLVIRPSKRTVAHMDSISPAGNSKYTERGLDWMRDVLEDKFVADEWKIVRHTAPRQTNGYDCGVHTVTNAMCVALGLSPIDSYSSAEMPLQRLRLASVLINGGFNKEFDLGVY